MTASSGSSASPRPSLDQHDSAEQDGTDIRNASVGQLLSDVSRDFSSLMRQEVALAKAEVKEEATKAAKGAGMMGGAGYAAHFIVVFLSLAAWWGLAAATSHIGFSALIVAAGWAVIAGVLFVVGRSTLKRVNPKPERTVATVGDIPPALKPNN